MQRLALRFEMRAARASGDDFQVDRCPLYTSELAVGTLNPQWDAIPGPTWERNFLGSSKDAATRCSHVHVVIRASTVLLPAPPEVSSK